MSDVSFTHDDLKAILTDRIGLSESDVPDDPDTPFSALGLDSLAVVEVQLELQQQYGVTAQENDARVTTTLGEAVAYVNDRLNSHEAV